MMSENCKIVVSVSNDLFSDQRVEKVCNTLHRKGYEIELIGRQLSDSKILDRPYVWKRFKLWFNKGPLFYLNLNLKLFFYLIRSDAQIFLANDLDTLLANYLAARSKGRKLVYDSHEYFTEVPELVERPFIRSIWKGIESWIVPKLDFAYTVSGRIAREYKTLYGTPFKVIRNFPIAANRNDQIIKREKVVIYQGALNLGRGLESLIDAFAFPDLNDYSLWLFGSGDIIDELKEQVEKKSLQAKVKFFGRLSPEELRPYTSKALLGVSLELPMGKNYQYALPNKVFDYIHASVPVLYAPLEEMKEVLDPLKIGDSLRSHHSHDLALQINSMIRSDEYEIWVSNCKKVAMELSWEKEELTLLNIFEDACQS